MRNMKRVMSRVTLLADLGYLPMDQPGADLLFQGLSLRDEQGAIILTANRALPDWPKLFNHESPLPAAILDRLLHHAETGTIAGQRFRMKEQIAGEPSRHEASPEAHRPCRRRPAPPVASPI